MNPNMNITAHQNRLDPDSEQVYGHTFFMGLDGVAAALDNVEASQYQCLCYSLYHDPINDITTSDRVHTLATPTLLPILGPTHTSSCIDINNITSTTTNG